MAIRTFIAVLRESDIPTASGVPVGCPRQPDGTPKPFIDYRGVIYRLLDDQGDFGIFDYSRVAAPSRAPARL